MPHVSVLIRDTAVCRRLHGFTLVELVLSMAVMSVLMIALASSVAIAGRALPDSQSALSTGIATFGITEQVAGDLLCAQSFNERSAAAVEFTVPDRNGDIFSETIRYDWSGTPGDPLMRTLNAGTAAAILDDVYDFQLTYDLLSRTEQPDPVTGESGELLLNSQDTSIDLKDFAIKDKEWIGQYFEPALPADTIEWKVTMVKFLARQHGGTNGVGAVQLRTPDAGKLPSTEILEQKSMSEAALPTSYEWQEFTFTNVSALTPNQGLCLVIARQVNDAHVADIEYDNSAGSGMLTTGDAGASWTASGSSAMRYYVYGKVTTGSLPDPVTREWMQAVGIRLQAGPVPAAAVETAVAVLNEPEVTAP